VAGVRVRQNEPGARARRRIRLALGRPLSIVPLNQAGKRAGRVKGRRDGKCRKNAIRDQGLDIRRLLEKVKKQITGPISGRI